jgi:multicomponent Na+:H+ antiporter subunit F
MSNLTNIVIYLAIIIIAIALILNLIRFLKGPTLIDKVIAFDALTIGSLAIIGIIAVLANRMIYLDVAIVYALLSFIGIIVIAKYLFKGF